MNKFNKTEQKILDNSFKTIIYTTEIRKIAAMRRLDLLGLINIKINNNDFGFMWFEVIVK